MAIMTFVYAMMVVSQALYLSYINEDDFVLWKYLAAYNTLYCQYLFPIPTMLYCLHNYNLLDKAANEHPSQCAKVSRYAFVYALVAALVVCVPLVDYFLNENWIRYERGDDDYGRFGTYFNKTFASASIFECICGLTSSALLCGIICWASHLRHRKDKIVLKTGNLNRGFICLHIVMIVIACALYIWDAAYFKWPSLYHRWLSYSYALFPIALDIVLCVII